MSKICGVYKYTNLINNKVYIGSSNDIDRRKREHLLNSSGCIRLKNAINKYGIENFKFEILEEVQEENLRTIENNYLNEYFAKEFILTNGVDKRFIEKTYNIKPSAEKTTGHKWSKESKINLKNKFKEKGHTCIGRKYSEETLNKIKNTHKERGVSVGNKNPNFGIKSTEEKKNKVNLAHIKSGLIYPVCKIDSNLNVEEFLNISEYCRNHKFTKRCVQFCIKNEIRTHKNYSFCKKEDLEKRLEDIKNNKNWFSKKHIIKNEN